MALNELQKTTLDWLITEVDNGQYDDSPDAYVAITHILSQLIDANSDQVTLSEILNYRPSDVRHGILGTLVGRAISLEIKTPGEVSKLTRYYSCIFKFIKALGAATILERERITTLPVLVDVGVNDAETLKQVPLLFAALDNKAFRTAEFLLGLCPQLLQQEKVTRVIDIPPPSKLPSPSLLSDAKSVNESPYILSRVMSVGEDIPPPPSPQVDAAAAVACSSITAATVAILPPSLSPVGDAVTDILPPPVGDVARDIPPAIEDDATAVDISAISAAQDVSIAANTSVIADRSVSLLDTTFSRIEGQDALGVPLLIQYIGKNIRVDSLAQIYFLLFVGVQPTSKVLQKVFGMLVANRELVVAEERQSLSMASVWVPDRPKEAQERPTTVMLFALLFRALIIDHSETKKFIDNPVAALSEAKSQRKSLDVEICFIQELYKKIFVEFAEYYQTFHEAYEDLQLEVVKACSCEVARADQLLIEALKGSFKELKFSNWQMRKLQELIRVLREFDRKIAVSIDFFAGQFLPNGRPEQNPAVIWLAYSIGYWQQIKRESTALQGYEECLLQILGEKYKGVINKVENAIGVYLLPDFSPVPLAKNTTVARWRGAMVGERALIGVEQLRGESLAVCAVTQHLQQEKFSQLSLILKSLIGRAIFIQSVIGTTKRPDSYWQNRLLICHQALLFALRNCSEKMLVSFLQENLDLLLSRGALQTANLLLQSFSALPSMVAPLNTLIIAYLPQTQDRWKIFHLLDSGFVRKVTGNTLNAVCGQLQNEQQIKDKEWIVPLEQRISFEVFRYLFLCSYVNSLTEVENFLPDLQFAQNLFNDLQEFTEEVKRFQKVFFSSKNDTCTAEKPYELKLMTSALARVLVNSSINQMDEVVFDPLYDSSECSIYSKKQQEEMVRCFLSICEKLNKVKSTVPIWEIFSMWLLASMQCWQTIEDAALNCLAQALQIKYKDFFAAQSQFIRSMPGFEFIVYSVNARELETKAASSREVEMCCDGRSVITLESAKRLVVRVINSYMLREQKQESAFEQIYGKLFAALASDEARKELDLAALQTLLVNYSARVESAVVDCKEGFMLFMMFLLSATRSIVAIGDLMLLIGKSSDLLKKQNIDEGIFWIFAKSMLTHYAEQRRVLSSNTNRGQHNNDAPQIVAAIKLLLEKESGFFRKFVEVVNTTVSGVILTMVFQSMTGTNSPIALILGALTNAQRNSSDAVEKIMVLLEQGYKATTNDLRSLLHVQSEDECINDACSKVAELLFLNAKSSGIRILDIDEDDSLANGMLIKHIQQLDEALTKIATAFVDCGKTFTLAFQGISNSTDFVCHNRARKILETATASSSGVFRFLSGPEVKFNRETEDDAAFLQAISSCQGKERQTNRDVMKQQVIQLYKFKEVLDKYIDKQPLLFAMYIKWLQEYCCYVAKGSKNIWLEILALKLSQWYGKALSSAHLPKPAGFGVVNITEIISLGGIVGSVSVAAQDLNVSTDDQLKNNRGWTENEVIEFRQNPLRYSLGTPISPAAALAVSSANGAASSSSASPIPMRIPKAPPGLAVNTKLGGNARPKLLAPDFSQLQLNRSNPLLASRVVESPVVDAEASKQVDFTGLKASCAVNISPINMTSSSSAQETAADRDSVIENANNVVTNTRGSDDLTKTMAPPSSSPP